MKFDVGDLVRYELSWWGKPRWIGNHDCGGSGRWEDARVVEVKEHALVVEGRSGRSAWPLMGHRNFSIHQWNWAGYLAAAGPETMQSSPTCVCGAEAVFGRGCGTHSSWCELAA